MSINGNTPAEYTQMVRDLAKPGQAIIDGLTPMSMHILHMAIGVVGETGEMREADLNHDRENMAEELGDQEFYVEGLAQALRDLGARAPNLDEVYAYLDEFPAHSSQEAMLHVVSCRLLDFAKKVAVYGRDVQVYLDQISLNFQAVRWLLIKQHEEHGFTIPELLDGNMTKLLKGDKARYKSGTYSDEQAQARADKGGAD